MDLSRDIGALEARMDDHDRRFDKLDEQMQQGFDGINSRLDSIGAAENRRKGAMGVIKLLFGAGTLTGIVEFIRELFHR